jgi:hypothetical protein
MHLWGVGVDVCVCEEVIVLEERENVSKDFYIHRSFV